MDVSITFLLLTFVAEVLGTVGGFGSSVFFVPIGSFYFDFHSVLGLVAIFHLSGNLSKIMLFRKGLDKKLIINIGIPSLIFVVIGGYLSAYVNPGILTLVLGVFLIAMSSLFLIRKNLEIKPERKQSIFGGSLSGFLSGFLGTGGAVRGLTMAAFNLEKSVFIATSAFIDFAIDGVRTFVYYQNGYIQKEDLIYVPYLLLIGLVGSYVGKRVLKKIPQDKFKMISLGLVLIIGIVTTLKYLF